MFEVGDIVVALTGEHKAFPDFFKVIWEDGVKLKLVEIGKNTSYPDTDTDSNGHSYCLVWPDLNRTTTFSETSATMVNESVCLFPDGTTGWLWNGGKIRQYIMPYGETDGDLVPDSLYSRYNEESGELAERVKDWDGNPFDERPDEYFFKSFK